MQPFEHSNNQSLQCIGVNLNNLTVFQPIIAINHDNFEEDPMQSQLQVEYILYSFYHSYTTETTKKTSLFKRSTYTI